MQTPSDDAQTAWIALMRASTRALSHVEAALKAAGLPPLAWYDALLEIERAEPDGVRPFALKERLLLPQYGTSRLLARLEEAGLIRREACAEDGRGQVVRITPAGRALRDRSWPVYAACIEELVGRRIDAAEARRLAQLLARIGPEERG